MELFNRGVHLFLTHSVCAVSTADLSQRGFERLMESGVACLSLPVACLSLPGGPAGLHLLHISIGSTNIAKLEEILSTGYGRYCIYDSVLNHLMYTLTHM